ncbi:RNA-guided endonuclease InsQ/TnpB family protein [Streptomyces sp. NPDC015232]|uniref:RNA-guided endonuclease InsQ/TnpB family protein n=1 Tax=unclassified Streptomyces TaxID=2593676 RepID=UPI0037028524
MKLTVQVKLEPTSDQAVALLSTLRACNEAASWVAKIAFENEEFKNFSLRKRVYGQVRERWGLGAQAAQHVIKRTCDAYAALRARPAAGGRGVSRNARYRWTPGRPVAFRPEGAQPFDDRMLSWRWDAGTVSLWTVRGRLKSVRFAVGGEQLRMLRRYRRGESDLLYRDGMWFLMATCEVPEAERIVEPSDYLGVDLGIVNIATTSDGEIFAGRRLNRLRSRERALRKKLLEKKTKSAKRRLRRRRRKEARRSRDVNHKIAKKIVAEAERTGRGIALEDLTGIRERVRLRKPQRAMMHTWAFAQLGGFIAYKARRAGVQVVYVDPSHTSSTCAACGHNDKANRVSQARFVCRSCGFVDHADRNGSRNIRARADDAAQRGPIGGPCHRETASGWTRARRRTCRRRPCKPCRSVGGRLITLGSHEHSRARARGRYGNPRRADAAGVPR